MSKIKYLAHYTNDLSKRAASPAGCNKMAYIINAISEIIGPIEVISACNTTLHSQKGSQTVLENNTTIKYLPSLYRGNKLFNIFSIIFLNLSLLFYLLFNIKKNDTIIVYHAVRLMWVVRFIKKIKDIKIILEVEEIYGDVFNSQKTGKKELKFFELADAYIFPTKLLEEKVNIKDKPSVIIHGTYEATPFYEKQLKDDKIHIVYAGTLDVRKGATTVVAAAEFLDSKYHIHILGFGGEETKNNLQKEIKKVSEKTDCIVTYDGCLSGEDYLRFLQSCDIGLSPQNPEATFNETSFPSKILSYMSNRLRVVSIRIQAIESSNVGGYIYYYDEQNPEEIAKAIMSVSLNDDYNSREIIEKLDKDFKIQIKSILEAMKR